MIRVLKLAFPLRPTEHGEAGLMSVVPYVATAVAGILNAVHSGTNAKLTETLGRPWWAAIVVCLVAAVVTIPGVLISRESVPDMSRVAQTPWWAWAGTAAAAVPVITTLLFAGQLGGAAFNGLVVTATIATSVLLDHFGLLGFAPHPATFWRIAGAFIMVAGLALVCLF